MSEKDFRYTMPDGSEVEGFQLTGRTRYQEKEWPAWMDSRYLITYEGGEERLNINDVETPIPKFGWIIRKADGTITAVDYEVMEEADKVVKEEPVVHPRADAGISDDALAKMHNVELPEDHTPEDPFREELKRSQPSTAELSLVRREQPETVEQPAQALVVNAYTDIVHSARLTYELLKAGDHEAAMETLHKRLMEGAQWCSCGPGNCDGTAERWNCRKNSPLVSA